MIIIRYSCTECGIKQRSINVAERDTEDVVTWVRNVLALAISKDHDAVSPNCQSLKVAEVMIPISGVDKIGGPTVN